MKTVVKGNWVEVHYTGMLEDGTVFDSTDGGDPDGFYVGDGTVIPAFEDALVGMSVGDRKEIDIDADEAYGARDDDAEQTFQLEDLEDDFSDAEPGWIVSIDLGNGQFIPMRIKELSEETITFDLNHPLAGEKLKYQVELVAVEEEAPEDW